MLSVKLLSPITASVASINSTSYLSVSSLQIHLLTVDKVYITTPIYVIVTEVDHLTIKQSIVCSLQVVLHLKYMGI